MIFVYRVCPPSGDWFVLVDCRAEVCAHINAQTGEVDAEHQALWL